MASDLFAKQSCTYCQEEVVGVRIKCAECEDFDLCLQCFASGVEIGPHKKNHSYQFVDSEAMDLYRSKCGWSAREALQLLSGIERYGFGNWDHISLLVKTRTPDECREEYLATFLEGSIGRATWPWALERRNRLTDVTKEDPGPVQPPFPAPLDVTPEQAQQLAYMPARDDLEREYDNDAENLVSNLNVTSIQDDELDIAMKLARVDMYSQRVVERMRRKWVARDYQLVSKFFNSVALKQKITNPEQHELEEQLRFMCQFLTCQEFEGFVASWQRELYLRKRAAELLRYRAAGLTRYEEIPHFEQETAGPPLLDSIKSPGRCVQGGVPRPLRPPSAQSPPPPLSPSLPHHQTRKREKSGEGGSRSTGKSSTYPTDSPTLSLQPGQQQQPQLQPPLAAHPRNSPSCSTDHLLSSTEKQLCSSLNLSASQFISIKTFLLTVPTHSPINDVERHIREHINNNGWFLT